jgi:capsular exopolysaccharide synthesis family protein
MPPGGFIATAAAGSHQMTGADVWRVMRSNMWLILSLLIASVIIGYGVNLYLLRYHSKFMATGVVQVNPPYETDPLKTNDRVLDYTILAVEQKNFAERLKIPALYSKVLQNQSSVIHETNWLAQMPSASLARQDLVEHLMVTPVMDTTQIRIEFATRDPQDAEKIVEALVDEELNEESTANSDYQKQLTGELNGMRQGLEQKRTDLIDSISDRESRLNISGQSGAGSLTAREAELVDLGKLKMDADLQAAVVKEESDRLEGQIAAGQDPPEVMEQINRDPEVQHYDDMITNMEAEITTETPKFGPENDNIKDMQARHDLLVKKWQDTKEAVRHAARDQVLADIRQKVKQSNLQLTELNDKIAGLNVEIAGLNKDLREYQSYRSQLDDVEKTEKEIDDRVDQTTRLTNQKDQTNLEWTSHPEASDIPTFPRLSVTMTMSIAIGLLLSLGIAFARETLDTTVRSPRDITRIGHMAVLGMVPHEDDDPQARGTRLPLVIFEAPQSMMAEELRQVRTRLQHAASLDTTRTILITSPSPDDGKSTIAANLASGLALNGRRILLVDANFRRPSCHRMFNLANDVGFSDVLNKLDVFETAVQETQVPNLYVLPSGLKPTNATELLESQLLADFIERALEEFDHVIFDSGPLLFVSETVALAPRVDGVVTVVRARANTRGLLTRLRDTLRQLKAEHLGVVLNAVRSQGGGYYRSNIRTYYDYQNGRAA